MQKIFCSLLVALLFGNAYSQSETFDIVTYTPPKNWKKDSKEGVVNYTNINTKTGGVCVITIYASTVSSGDAQKDFAKSWVLLSIKRNQVYRSAWCS